MPIIPIDTQPVASEPCVAVPGSELPNFRISIAIQKNVHKNILIVVCGGLGDAICAEPAIRYACDNFHECEISISSWWPELYAHLPIKRFYNITNKEVPKIDDYLVFKTIEAGDCLKAEFFCHMFTHVTDYHSLAMFRVQLPPEVKDVRIPVSVEEFSKADSLINVDNDVVIHAGATWQSKTIPHFWWNDTLKLLKANHFRPVIIGRSPQTVSVNTEGCLDLRDRLSIRESIAVCQLANAVIMNDSSPLHMAATGNAAIAFLTTVKRPDLLMHYRKGVLGHQMKNFTNGGFWELCDNRPFNTIPIHFDRVDPAKLISWLPKPAEVVNWIAEKMP